MASEQELDQLFAQYRAGCPDVELSANFMPELWGRIEARKGFWPVFEHLARAAVSLCALACLVVALLNFAAVPRTTAPEQSYAEALASDQSAEAIFYADAIRPSPVGLSEESR
jgi:hypothetical protein